jgi:hypothetical protein
MAKSKIWHTTGEAAELTGASQTTVWRTCRQYPGFAVRLNGTFKIPDEHVKRILAGEHPSQISRQAQAGGALNAA